MTILVLLLCAGVAGYGASILTWPRIRPWLIGIENEIADLRAKARALESKLRG